MDVKKVSEDTYEGGMAILKYVMDRKWARVVSQGLLFPFTPVLEVLLIIWQDLLMGFAIKKNKTEEVLFRASADRFKFVYGRKRFKVIAFFSKRLCNWILGLIIKRVYRKFVKPNYDITFSYWWQMTEIFMQYPIWGWGKMEKGKDTIIKVPSAQPS